MEALMGVGIDNIDYYKLASNFANSRQTKYYSNYNNSNRVSNPYQVQQAQVDTYVSQEGNTCTDGKDDGRIGLPSVLGNIIQGAGKSIVNGIKGMFTDKDGNFSILKTAASVAIGAACIAFPAVGLAACAIGVLAGGTKLVKGVATAINSKTDAEAKDAWEAVGDGGLTVALSVVGAKASYGAMKAGAVQANGVSAINGLKNSASYQNASALGKAGQFAKALGQDAWASTKFSWGKVKTAAGNLWEALKIRKAQKTVERYNKYTDTDFNNMSADKNVKIQSDYKEAQAILNSSEGTEGMNIADKIQAHSEASQAAKATLKGEQAKLSYAKKALKAAQKSGDEKAIAKAQAELQKVETSFKAAKNNVGFGKLTSTVRSKLSNTNTADYLSNNYTRLTEGGIKNIINNIKANRNSIKVTEILKNASSDVQNVINYLKSSDCTYYDAVREFGHENVLEALKVFAGCRMVDETV